MQDKLTGKTMPTVHEMVDSNGSLSIFSMVTSPIPKVKFSVVIESDLFRNGATVSHQQFWDVKAESKIEYSSDILKLITFLHNYAQNDSPTEDLIDTTQSLSLFRYQNEI